MPGRQNITDEAARLFITNGYAETTLRDIAAAVGIKAGSIYYHFASKEDLLVDVMQQGMVVMVDAFAATAAQTEGQPAAQRVTEHIRAHLESLFNHGPYTTTHVSTFHYAPDSVKAEVVPLRDAYERLWTELFAELQADGQIGSDVDLSLTRLSLMGSMNAAIDWFDQYRGDLERFVEVVGYQFWHGVGVQVETGSQGGQ
ncbi:MAG: TetR/AcrR family transcriptional regulator [Actinomycetia bacterium]|nr:TetR/AcrR family transcriptional regulator [Actinomycetes bacterium]MCP4960126.1 TetR/AcrR family transcriptional regulator [Actinomycetes bacterium]